MLRKKGLRFKRFFRDGKALSIASRRLITCNSSDSIGYVIGLMLSGKRKIPVLQDGKFNGIVTINDMLDYAGAGNKHEFFDNKNPLGVKVSSIMDKRVMEIPAGSSLESAWNVFKEYRRGSYPMTSGKKVIGILADWDFLKNIRGDVRVKVEELMIRRPAQIKEHYTLMDVAKIMVRGGYRRLPVTKSGILTGIMLPSDILGSLQSMAGLKGLKEGSKTVSSIMETEVKTVSPRADVGVAVRKMLSSKVGGLPVVEDQELVGIITESDIIQGLV